MKILSHGYVLLSNLLLIISIANVSNGVDYEADYMFQLMKAITPTPTGWSNKTHYCKWKGISCNSTTQVVTSIMLPSSSLTGTLPPYIYTLTNLTHIDLHNNSLNGSLPDFEGLLLQIVSLGHNNFTSIPDDCFRYLSDLRTLNLSNNLNLDPWVFPMDDLSFSTSLETLDLNATNMIGPLLPEKFDSFPNLHTFIISHNKLKGSLPQSLAKSAVRYLHLNNNSFSGTIDVISSMSKLSQSWLHNNTFSGQIPNMSNCINLFDLQLQSNFLTGLVPPSLLALSSLNIISLDNNILQGPIPVFHKGVKATWESNNFCRSDVGPCDPQVTILNKISEALGSPSFLSTEGNNVCTGGQWTSISTDNVLIKCERGKIVTLKFRDFRLTGTISPAFCKLTSLVNLTLARIKLTGSIPPSLTTLPQLQILDVSNNNLSGVIPKFSSKVKLNTTGNVLLRQNMSRQDGGDVQTQGSSKANLRLVIWITGTLLYFKVFCFVTYGHVQVLLSIHSHLNYKQ
ncbi:receptor protein kinase TMK1-like protein [Trifolium pratense]|uniref:Receptor protein kinase TMK1-like protein n=1 Tax=Trifolium pratense TaxID=57577 RepID=A0A2K3NJF8_TRIPR|nr:receptor protein kinase TMK1-like protein [Trifolium pratense]